MKHGIMNERGEGANRVKEREEEKERKWGRKEEKRENEKHGI